MSSVGAGRMKEGDLRREGARMWWKDTVPTEVLRIHVSPSMGNDSGRLPSEWSFKEVCIGSIEPKSMNNRWHEWLSATIHLRQKRACWGKRSVCGLLSKINEKCIYLIFIMSGKPNVKTVQFIMCWPLNGVHFSLLQTGESGRCYTLLTGLRHTVAKLKSAYINTDFWIHHVVKNINA